MTGAAHAVLTPYWTARLGRDSFVVRLSSQEPEERRLATRNRYSPVVLAMTLLATLARSPEQVFTRDMLPEVQGVEVWESVESVTGQWEALPADEADRRPRR